MAAHPANSAVSATTSNTSCENSDARKHVLSPGISGHRQAKMRKGPLQRAVYPFPFELCCEAYLQRYPTHPERIPLLLASRVIEDRIITYADYQAQGGTAALGQTPAPARLTTLNRLTSTGSLNHTPHTEVNRHASRESHRTTNSRPYRKRWRTGTGAFLAWVRTRCASSCASLALPLMRPPPYGAP